jgi:prephenate dehydratase
VSDSSKVGAPTTVNTAVVAGSKSPRVAFQGRRGAFSETAIRRLFPAGAVPVECRDFETLFSAIRESRADFIVAPLENTLAGTVYQCYDLLYDAGLSIIDETVLQI